MHSGDSPSEQEKAHPCPIRVLIVDDEELARVRLATLIAAITDLPVKVVGEAAHAAATLAWLQQHSCDVVLLDIAMPGPDGMALAARLREVSRPDRQSPEVVFVTAHAAHALQAFELDAVDYLTKPVRRERLHAALNRVSQRLVARGLVPMQPVAAPATEEAAILIPERGHLLRVPVSEILYLKAEQKYVGVRTASRLHLLDTPLAELEARWGERFIRIHRNALVARHAIRALERRWTDEEGHADESSGNEAAWAVRVALVDEWLSVSRRQLPLVREALRAP